MKWFRDLKLRSKLLLAFGSVIAVALIGTTLTLQAISDMQDAFDVQERSDRLEQVGIDAVGALASARASFTEHVLGGGPTSEQDLEVAASDLADALDQLRAISGEDDALAAQWADIDEALATVDESIVQPGLELRREIDAGTEDPAAAIALITSAGTSELYDRVAADLADVIAGISASDLAATNDTATTAEDVARGAVVATLLTIAMCLFWALVVARLLADPMRRISTAFERLGTGDLRTEPLGIDGGDEIGQLGRAFDATVGTLSLAGAQAEAVGQGRVNDSVLDRALPGDLGESFDDMVSYLRELASVADVLSQGDLTPDVSLRSEADSLGWALRRMTISLRSTVENVRQATLQVRNGATALAHGAEGSAGLAGEVAATVQTIRAALDEQTRATTDVATAIVDIREGVITANDTVARAVDAAGRAGDLGREGELRMAALGDAMARIDTWNQTAVERFDELDVHSRRVEEMVDLIADVAEQTKVLALNAAIEAARAGEAGRGFSVVAAEVKTLSDQTAESSKQVAAIVDQMQALLEQAQGAMTAGRRDVERGTRAVETSESTFGAITEAVREVGARLDVADQVGRSIREGSITIEGRTSRLVAIAEENTHSATVVADAAERTASTAVEIGETATELATNGELLTAAVSRFRLRSLPPPTPPPAAPTGPPTGSAAAEVADGAAEASSV